MKTVRIDVDGSRVVREGKDYVVRLRKEDFKGVNTKGLDPAADVKVEVAVHGDHQAGKSELRVYLPNGVPTKPDVPIFADRLLMTRSLLPNGVARKVQDQVSVALFRSRKFVFSSEGSERVGEMVRDYASFLADYGEFIRLPYPSTWVELDANAFMRGLGVDDPRANKDQYVGYLYDGNNVYVGAEAEDGSSMMMPMRYRLHMGMSDRDCREVARLFSISQMGVDQFLWGASYDGLDPTHRRSLRADHTVESLITNLPDGAYGALLNGGGAGDLRNALGIAMMLLRPSMTDVLSERGPRRRPTSLRGPRAYAAHTVVTVRLSPKRLVREIKQMVREERATTRWHEVRAHYCHDAEAKRSPCVRKAIDADPGRWLDVYANGVRHPAFIDLMLVAHDWVAEKPDRWVCRGCEGHRWWRAYPDGRGDAGVGYVRKHYQVVP